MKTIFLIIAFNICLFPQVISEPIESNIYNFIYDIQNKTIFNQPFRIPLTRTQISNILNGYKSINNLTKLEKTKLNYYLGEYERIYPGKESSILKNEKEFYHLYSYRDSSFSFIVDPIFTVAYQKGNEGKTFYRNGLYVRGDFLKSWGYSLLFYDNHSSFKGNNKFNYFSRKPGIHIAVAAGDFSELRGGVYYDFGVGRISAAKDFLKIGSGIDGQIIVSDKAPSFPYFNLELDPVDWLNFNYYLGFLSSGLIDSSTLINTYNGTTYFNNTFDRRDKYIALHYLTFNPWSTLSLTLGESVVFNDRMEYLYLIPVMFFRLADHFYSNKDSGDNVQIFLDASYRILPLSAKVYGTLFIDELSVTKVLEGDKAANKHLGFTLGTYITDALIKNSSFNIEYTRINPFVYSNFNPAQTYYSSSYQLGHWIGSNADQIHLSHRQNFQIGSFMKVNNISTGSFGYIEVWFDYIRKGKKETIDEQYNMPYPGFLYGGVSYYSDFGISFNWEPINTLKLKIEYLRHLKSNERFVSEYGITEKDWMELSIGYGL